MEAVFLLLALVGHASVWVAAVNRVHSYHWPRWLIRCCTTLLLSLPGVAALALLWWLFFVGGSLVGQFHAAAHFEPWPLALVIYLGYCAIRGMAVVIGWFRRRLLHRPPDVVRSHTTRSMDIAGESSVLSERPHHFLVRLPGNESLQLDLSERAIDVPRLPPALDGLSIVHLSDFHFTGRVAKSFFQEVVRISNDLQPDVVAITGDLVDRNYCLDWLPDTLGQLWARDNVYFVLGNHDLRVDWRRMLNLMRESGLVHVGGRWIESEIRGQQVLLAGSELPWRGPAADPAAAPHSRHALRIALAHSPDQLDWAQACDADLLLVGHTHGGQIRLPIIGPIFSPSREGVTYASGIFHDPPTIMHVTRGVSGQVPLRLNCPPEMALLRLHAAPPA